MIVTNHRSPQFPSPLLRDGARMDAALDADGREYVEATRDLWQASPGAVDRLSEWLDARPVRRWLKSVQRAQDEGDPRVRARLEEVVREIGE